MYKKEVFKINVETKVMVYFYKANSQPQPP
jgi:hypothetical protein